MPDLLNPVSVTVVSRAGEITEDTAGSTPGNQPNVMIVALKPMWIIFIRALRTYLQTLVGLLSAAGIGAASNTLPVGDFWLLLQVCAGLSVGGAVVSALMNTIELLARVDQSAPSMRA